MPTTIGALLDLQAVERDIAHVSAKLRSRANAVALHQNRIGQLRTDFEALHKRCLDRRKEADRLELELKSDEEKVSRLRAALTTARTNKEYASILTQINTIKADNAKIEDQALKVLQDVDALGEEATKIQQSIEIEENRLAETEATSRTEIERLSAMLEDLRLKRDETAKAVPPKALALFERLCGSREGDAMAPVEKHGRKPPHDYVCGGCFMGLTAEHVNALRMRDEIRVCDNCGRILYLQTQEQEQDASADASAG